MSRREELVNSMKLTAKAIVSNSDMIKSYKSCRAKASTFGKIFILKNNKPDAVLYSIAEYERISEFIERLDDLEPVNIADIEEVLPKAGK
ncbi:MAG: type II toxin-antitoxin system prevent-host-death family antitoxin [Eubacteriales bacterium]|nr:type II toxin-antitoxin system prevent-host-death family antitoxin [Eubacteriales bacterium]